MSEIKLSIIVPVYNVEKYIKRCLDSLIQQSLDNYEIIVVNDGTEDNSMEYVYSLQKIYSRIVVCERENGGLSAARNTGIKQAKGEYILFCDSDDALQVNCLSMIYNEAKSKNLDMLLYGAKTIWEIEAATDINAYFKDNITQEVVSGKEMLAEFVHKGKYTASACMYLIKRKMLIQNGLFFVEKILHEDELFTPIVLMKAQRVEYRNWLIYMRFVREGSITTSNNVSKRLKSLAIVIKELIQYADKELKKENDLEVFWEIICERIRIFLGETLCISKSDQELEEYRKEIVYLVRKKHVKLGLKFYCYLMYQYLRKM